MATTQDPSVSRTELRAARSRPEHKVLGPLLELARLSAEDTQSVLSHARELGTKARSKLQDNGGIEAFMQEYDLSSQEGVLLMCLAEALLRIPDTQTQEQLIRDKLARGHWDDHLGHSHSLFVNASTWGLYITGQIVALGPNQAKDATTLLQRLIARSGEKAVRLALAEAMEVLARNFVLGATIESALKKTADSIQPYSFDCLGEAAKTLRDVEHYYNAYQHAIATIGNHYDSTIQENIAPNISIKLSALHPRYEYSQRERVFRELVPKLRLLATQARDADLTLTIDAEESERLELSLDIFETLYRDKAFSDWPHLGLAVQAYQKRALPLLQWLAQLAQTQGKRIPVRLVKGAYWDSEIKRAQIQGLHDYPVFTRKHATDVSFLACARYLLSKPKLFYGQFATHNAYSIAYVLQLTKGHDTRFEFQRLHGMGQTLYEVVQEKSPAAVHCRVYAPVGSHEQLLPYLVRRLLENGANTSFVNQLADTSQDLAQVIIDPVAYIQEVNATPHPHIPLPPQLYGEERRNSQGTDLTDPAALQNLNAAIHQALERHWDAAPLINGEMIPGKETTIHDPSDRRRVTGVVTEANVAQLELAFEGASQAVDTWQQSPAEERALALERCAELFEQHRAELMALCIREAGRTLADAISEVREAVDFCRYYAMQARQQFAQPQVLSGPTGESNQLQLHGRGVFACISPWNFPIAIFTGQIAAALAAGNTVVAKSARQTPLSACLIIRLMHQAGISAQALQFLPGSSAVLGTALLNQQALAGIAFTGSTDTAWTLQQTLAQRREQGPIIPLIAETGGLNAMIVDSSALPEQVVSDIIASGFNSAGQRCSALRIVFIQHDIADRLIEMLIGAMQQLRIGDPLLDVTDVGPVIDEHAKNQLINHAQRMFMEGKLLQALQLPPGTEHGSYFAPRIFEIDSVTRLQKEVFGPIVHIIRYSASALDQVIDAINDTHYGLTLGLHSRIEANWERVRQRARVGNLYINRNMIGAVVGVQPFGGEGLSGTGPKAGGPNYLHGFATERTVSINTAAVGGNASILSVKDAE